MNKFYLALTALLLSFAISFPAFAEKTPEDAKVQEWAQSAALDIMTFHFGNFDARLVANEKYFTPYGYKNFSKALERARIREAVTTGKQMVQSEIHCLPEITEKSDEQGVPAWKLTMPILVRYVVADKMREDNLILTLKVHKILKDAQPVFAIDQWVAFPPSASNSTACSKLDRAKAKVIELQNELAAEQEKVRKLEAEKSPE